MTDATFACAFPGKYEHQPTTFVSDGPPKDADWLDALGYLPKGTEYQACGEDCPRCEDYGFLECSFREGHRFGFVPYRKAWDIEKRMKAEGRCLDCGERLA